uniref:GH16 domain-containing protein n=1 Tax=Globisporangium ultimum (strain ATCC 200006 / CBS 805.95 / DAOM BR144) TaxID=431595 RepID=K3X0H9_GLOUD
MQVKTQIVLVAAVLLQSLQQARGAEFETKSGIRTWVDPATPNDRQTYISTRGEQWDLVMSDEFNTPGRSFKPGDDHMWTSIDKPDGVNAALEVYSHNMTSTKCDDDGTCYFYIMATDEATTLKLWNDYKNPPGYQTTTFHYRAGMVQSWNKFCFQGGMVEVRVQLPGVVDGNPDAAGGASAQAATKKYYPTWPGIWMMGNLGRAIFSASTNRMWPFSYDECNDDVFLSSNQRISACNSNPGSGMNPNQGRGAPEIDILEGAGNEVSSSIQLGPGMPTDFRIIYPTEDLNSGCVYTGSCTTKGANVPDVPTAFYKSKRGHKSWYQGLRYGANNFCAASGSLKQDYTTVKASMDKGITENSCTVANCPGSKDANADISLIDGSTTNHWSINTNGTCFPTLNGYTGAYLCSPGNPSSLCEKTDVPQSDKMKVFEYQMDAISANWPIHVAAYTSYLVYQLEWVMGDTGYVRWMLAGQPLFEIPSSAIVNPPQDSAKKNPKKIMIEEPMYMIFNVALSSTWGTQPPNAGKACRGDGTDAVANKICDSFPLYMKIDYIRLYQDTSKNSTMAVGCDPKSHPTKQWIQDHIDEYQDFDNLAIDVSGKGFCRTDDDCTISQNKTKVTTGSCVKSRCKCIGASWTGPRCTATLGTVETNENGVTSISVHNSYGPPWYLALLTSGLTLLVTFVAVYLSIKSAQRHDADRKRQMMTQPKSAMSIGSASDVGIKPDPKENYSTNFV